MTGKQVCNYYNEFLGGQRGWFTFYPSKASYFSGTVRKAEVGRRYNVTKGKS